MPLRAVLLQDPGQTVVTERVLYISFDLTSELRAGENAIGALLGNYKYGQALPSPCALHCLCG